MNEIIPKVSIVIPIYNGEKYLLDTINSILSSTYRKIELILIDDGSDDKSREICEHIMSQDNRIHYYFKENAGIVSARNYGLDKATGDFICFCDQDDIVKENMYELLLNKMISTDSELCLCGAKRLIGNTEINDRPVYINLEGVFYKEDIKKYFLLPLIFSEYKVENPVMANAGNSIWNCMFRMDFLKSKNIRFEKLDLYGDDFRFMINSFSQCKCISTINKDLYLWRYNINSESHRDKYYNNREEQLNERENYLVSIAKRLTSDEEMLKRHQLNERLYELYEIFRNEVSMYNPKSKNEKYNYLKNYIKAKRIQEVLINSDDYMISIYLSKLINALKKGDIKSAYRFAVWRELIRKIKDNYVTYVKVWMYRLNIHLKK